MNIDQRIQALPENLRMVFIRELYDVIGDRVKCEIFDLDYANPNVGLAKEKLYFQLRRKTIIC